MASKLTGRGDRSPKTSVFYLILSVSLRRVSVLDSNILSLNLTQTLTLRYEFYTNTDAVI